MENVKYYEFDNFRLDMTRYQLLKDGTLIPLTYKSFGVLHILLKNAGNVVDKETIISEIWGNTFVEQSNLSQQIYILRKILGNDAEGKMYIETITKRGFRFTKHVVEISAEIKLKYSNPTDAKNTVQSLRKIDDAKSNKIPETPLGIIDQSRELLKKPNRIFQIFSNLLLTIKNESKNHTNLSLLLVILTILGSILVAGYIYNN